MIELTLYSRSYCHLCDDLLAALAPLQVEYAFSVRVIDVDGDLGLVERYDELVPVLTALKNGEEAELCHYFLDEQAVRAYLQASTLEIR
ncbi:MAG: glutaredoxin family protein [Burkholderiales bacterium]|nr:glutaredoxin family protein [Burkholderiales bacterium]